MTILKAVVRYRGTHFAGWQVQPGQRTVQGVIEDALSTIAQAPIRIIGAGRTDAGVHALNQVFSCAWPREPDCARLQRSLSQMLAPEVRLESVSLAPDNFHPIDSAVAKTYTYAFYDGALADPFAGDLAWALPWSVDRQFVRSLAQRLVGEHDFQGFCASGSSVKTTVRTIHKIELHDGPVVGPINDSRYWHLAFHGNGFLYKMVRNIVGTLIDIARNQLPDTAVSERLAAPMPYRGFTAPPHGLYLAKVQYSD